MVELYVNLMHHSMEANLRESRKFDSKGSTELESFIIIMLKYYICHQYVKSCALLVSPLGSMGELCFRLRTTSCYI